MWCGWRQEPDVSALTWSLRGSHHADPEHQRLLGKGHRAVGARDPWDWWYQASATDKISEALRLPTHRRFLRSCSPLETDEFLLSFKPEVRSLFSYSFSLILFSSICFFTVFLPLLPLSCLILITIDIQDKYIAPVPSWLPYSEGKFQVREKGTEQAWNFGAGGHCRDRVLQISPFTGGNNETGTQQVSSN